MRSHDGGQLIDINTFFSAQMIPNIKQCLNSKGLSYRSKIGLSALRSVSSCQASSFSMLSKTRMLTRLSGGSPVNETILPPVARKRPPYLSTVAGTRETIP
jgi:hypothetical protein